MEFSFKVDNNLFDTMKLSRNYRTVSFVARLISNYSEELKTKDNPIFKGDSELFDLFKGYLETIYEQKYYYEKLLSYKNEDLRNKIIDFK